MKCIVFIRTSTERQDIESQKKETTEYAKSLGFDEFVYIGTKGASAVKRNEIYLEKIEELKQTILTTDIRNVVVFHLNRLARNGVQAMMIKEFLVKQQCQLYVKEPSIRLLKDNGEQDSGAALAFALFAELSEQQAAEFKAKSKRGRKRNKEIGKFNGGMYVLFGYRLDENRFVVPDERDSKILNEIFSMYASGNYSYNTLRKEIMERYGMDVSTSWLRCKFNDRKYFDGTYPPIIDEELFNMCQNVKNNARDKHLKIYHTFANRLIRCSKCGYGYTARIANKQPVYHCKSCKGNFITAANLDGLLWLVCSNLESVRLSSENVNSEILTNKATINEKLQQVDKQYQKYEKVQERAKEAYLNGIIDLSDYNQRLEGIKKDVIELDNRRLEYQRQITMMDEMLQKKENKMERLLAIADKVQSSDEIAMREIVRRWVTKIDFADKTLEIHTLKGTYKAIYVAKGEKKVIFTTINGNPLMVAPIKRQKGIVTLDRENRRCDKKNLVNTLAWLSGSQII